jgi:type IV secretory pathway TraG/TraD family ATPase VirD4
LVRLRLTRGGGGRPVPFLGVLDEAANICRFKYLDDYYSHLGSGGIIMLTILQNWPQGEQVWGKEGMEKLWNAANIKIYGGGVDDDRFLRRLSDLIGPYERIQRSESITRGSGRQRSASVAEKSILTVSQLRELPTGRAVAFCSGIPAALIEPQPWHRSDGAEQITASIAAHNPPDTPPAQDMPSDARLAATRSVEGDSS